MPRVQSLSRRAWLNDAAGALGFASLQGCRLLRPRSAAARVGILHSLSGNMALSESPLRDAEMMAVEEINAQGGVFGRPVETIIEDAGSDPERFAAKAEELLVDRQVCSVFGGWTSASRKAMLPVFEKHNGLLWYPLQYEGNECSANIFYGGAAPNQQIQPAVSWLLTQGRKRFFLAGSDYLFPRTANIIMRKQLEAEGGTVVGEEYVPLGGRDFDAMIAAIRKDPPDVIFSTINGDSNVYFFRALRKQGITADRIPVMMASVAEAEVRTLGVDLVGGHYACWNYFQSIDSPENRGFIERFRKRYGRYRVTDDPIETAYSQVHLWARAVTKAGFLEPEAIRKAAPGLEFASPGGKIRIDEHNHHTWKPFYIGQINEAGQFDIRYSSPSLMAPEPWSQALNPGKACSLG
jgi:urea transport system substrate-binding protein